MRERFGISNDSKFAGLVMRLNSAANRYHLAGSTVSSTDSAVANWIRDRLTLKALKTIARARETNAELFKEMTDYVGGKLDSINRERINYSRSVAKLAELKKRSEIPTGVLVPENVVEQSMTNAIDAADLETVYQLQTDGFDVQYVGEHFALGGKKFVERWFEMAPLVLAALAAVESKLRERNYGKDKLAESVRVMQSEKGLATNPVDALTRENIFYGRDLPKIYERITGNNFEGVRQDAEVSNQPCYRFVRRAARIVGISSPANITIQDHFDKLKNLKLHQ